MPESIIGESLFLARERTQHCDVCGHTTQQEIRLRGEEQYWWCTTKRNGKF